MDSYLGLEGDDVGRIVGRVERYMVAGMPVLGGDLQREG